MKASLYCPCTQKGNPKSVAMLSVLGIALFLSLGLTITFAYHTLILGDSYDRFAVKAMCEIAGGELTVWADSHVAYLPSDYACYYCKIKERNITIASVMIFGSNATGPYYLQARLEAMRGSILTTPERIHYALERYLSLFPHPPDIIFFHTNLWDLVNVGVQRLAYDVPANTPGTVEFQHAVDFVYRNTQLRLHELYRQLQGHGLENTTRLALRSVFEVPYPFGCIKDAYKVLPAMNEALAALATQMQLSYFDLNVDVDSAFYGHYEICRYILGDELHLWRSMAASTGRKLAAMQYSRELLLRPATAIQLHPVANVYTPGANASAKTLPSSHYWLEATATALRSMTTMPPDPFLITDRHPRYFDNLTAHSTASGIIPHLYFLTYVNGQPRRHTNVTLGFLELFRLSACDIAVMTPEQLQAIPVSYAIPRSFQSSMGRYPDGVIARLVSETDEETLQLDAQTVQAVCGNTTTTSGTAGVSDALSLSLSLSRLPISLSNVSFEYFFLAPGMKQPIVQNHQGDKFNCTGLHRFFAKSSEVRTRYVVHVPWSLLDYLVPERWVFV